jgi:hypothetical protein
LYSKSIDNLSNRLDRLDNDDANNDDDDVPYATAQELKQMTSEESYEARFNWHVKEIIPYYKAEVMKVHNITSDEEYNRRVLAGDQSIYLPQPNNKFEPTYYETRIAQVLGLDYKGIEDKMNRGEIERRIAPYRDPKTGKLWYDEDPHAVF